MERLKSIKDRLLSCVESQVNDLASTDTKELGEAIDMIKDLEETIYYSTVIEAMKDKEQEKMYYPMTYVPRYYGSAYDRGMRDYDNVFPNEIRDYREGRSGSSRRTYMESKEMHQGKEKQMMELEKYMNELTKDIMEMINDTSIEEKQILSQKLNTLADKIK